MASLLGPYTYNILKHARTHRYTRIQYARIIINPWAHLHCRWLLYCVYFIYVCVCGCVSVLHLLLHCLSLPLALILVRRMRSCFILVVISTPISALGSILIIKKYYMFSWSIALRRMKMYYAREGLACNAQLQLTTKTSLTEILMHR